MFRALRLMFAALCLTLIGRLVGRPRHPSWPFSFELVVRYLRLDWEGTADWDLARLSADMNARPYPRDYAKKVRHVDERIAGLPVRRFVPPAKKGDGILLFLHGGSYLFGSATSTHCEVMSRLAYESGLEVIGPDFRLTPEHRYPAQLEDALAVWDALVQLDRSAASIALVGDSSGGNLAAALALALRDQGRPLPAALVLISPWCDLEMPGASFRTNDRYDFGTREVLTRHARAFAGIVPLSDPRVSPTHANLTGLCPCLVVLGEVELPYDDIIGFAEKLKAAGVETAVHVARGMPHNPPALAGLHPEGAAACGTIVEYVTEKLR